MTQQTVSQNQTKESYGSAVTATVNILKEHLEGTLPSLENIARRLEISESTLKRHFKEIMGFPVYDYYLQLKMEKAKKMIVDDELGVRETAYALGYEKVSNFIAIFKKRYGMPPGKMKKIKVDEKENQ